MPFCVTSLVGCKVILLISISEVRRSFGRFANGCLIKRGRIVLGSSWEETLSFIILITMLIPISLVIK